MGSVMFETDSDFDSNVVYFLNTNGVIQFHIIFYKITLFSKMIKNLKDVNKVLNIKRMECTKQKIYVFRLLVIRK